MPDPKLDEKLDPALPDEEPSIREPRLAQLEMQKREGLGRSKPDAVLERRWVPSPEDMKDVVDSFGAPPDDEELIEMIEERPQLFEDTVTTGGLGGTQRRPGGPFVSYTGETLDRARDIAYKEQYLRNFAGVNSPDAMENVKRELGRGQATAAAMGILMTRDAVFEGKPEKWAELGLTEEQVGWAEEFLEGDRTDGSMLHAGRFLARMDRWGADKFERKRDTLFWMNTIADVSKILSFGLADPRDESTPVTAMLGGGADEDLKQDLAREEATRDPGDQVLSQVVVAAPMLLSIAGSARSLTAGAVKAGMSPAKARFLANTFSAGIFHEVMGGDFQEGLVIGAVAPGLGARVSKTVRRMGLDPTQVGRFSTGVGEGVAALAVGGVMDGELRWDDAISDFVIGVALGRGHQHVSLMDEWKAGRKTLDHAIGPVAKADAEAQLRETWEKMRDMGGGEEGALPRADEPGAEVPLPRADEAGAPVLEPTEAESLVRADIEPVRELEDAKAGMLESRDALESAVTPEEKAAALAVAQDSAERLGAASEAVPLGKAVGETPVAGGGPVAAPAPLPEPSTTVVTETGTLAEPPRTMADALLGSTATTKPVGTMTPAEVDATGETAPAGVGMGALIEADDPKATPAVGGAAWKTPFKKTWSFLTRGSQAFKGLANQVSGKASLAASKSSNSNVAGAVAGRLYESQVLRPHGVHKGKAGKRWGAFLTEEDLRGSVEIYTERAKHFRDLAEDAAVGSKEWGDLLAIAEKWETQARQIATVSLVGAEGSPFKTAAEFDAYRTDAKTASLAAAYNEWWNANKEPLFVARQGKWGPDTVAARGPTYGTRSNLFPWAAVEASNQFGMTGKAAGKRPTPADPEGRPTLKEGGKRGLGTSPFRQRVLGSVNGYVIDPIEMMSNSFAGEMKAHGRMELVSELLKNNAAIWVAEGLEPGIVGGSKMAPIEIHKPHAEEGKPDFKLWVREDVARDVRGAFKLTPGVTLGGIGETVGGLVGKAGGEKGKRIGGGIGRFTGDRLATPLLETANKISLQTLGDNVVNIARSVWVPIRAPLGGVKGTALALTGLKVPWVFGKMIRNMVKQSRRFGDVESLERMFEMAQRGSFRSGGIESFHGMEGAKKAGLGKQVALAAASPFKVIHGVMGNIGRKFDESSRELVSEIGKGLQKQGLMAEGDVQLRNFENQLGLYNRYAQGIITRNMVSTRIFPFQTAATANFSAMVRGFLGVSDVGKVSAMTRLKNQIEIQAQYVGSATLLVGLNMARTGTPFGREGVRFGDLDLGEEFDDDRGRPRSIRLMEITGAGKALKYMGVMSYITNLRRGFEPEEAADSAMDMVRIMMSRPGSSPVSNIVSTMTTGNTVHGMDLAPAEPPHESEAASNIGTALYELTPAVPFALMIGDAAGLGEEKDPEAGTPQWAYQQANSFFTRDRREGDTFVKVLEEQSSVFGRRYGLSEHRLKTLVRDARFARMAEDARDFMPELMDAENAELVPKVAERVKGMTPREAHAFQGMLIRQLNIVRNVPGMTIEKLGKLTDFGLDIRRRMGNVKPEDRMEIIVRELEGLPDPWQQQYVVKLVMGGMRKLAKEEAAARR